MHTHIKYVEFVCPQFVCQENHVFMHVEHTELHWMFYIRTGRPDCDKSVSIMLALQSQETNIPSFKSWRRFSIAICFSIKKIIPYEWKYTSFDNTRPLYLYRIQFWTPNCIIRKMIFSARASNFQAVLSPLTQRDKVNSERACNIRGLPEPVDTYVYTVSRGSKSMTTQQCPIFFDTESRIRWW